MSQPTARTDPDASEVARTRPMVSRPGPDETAEQFSARLVAELLAARRSEEQPGTDAG